MVGSGWMPRPLEQMAQKLVELGAAEHNLHQLSATAHQLASATGALGFIGVSELCREVEEACVQGHGIEHLLRDLNVAQSAAISQIEKLKSQDAGQHASKGAGQSV